MTTAERIPPEFDVLLEPARSKAFEFFQELLDHGSNESDAIEQAIDRAQSWVAERAKSAH